MLYVLNALPNSFLHLIAHTAESSAVKEFRKLSESEAIAYLSGNQFQSAIGYESTAALLSIRLKAEIFANRITVAPDPANNYLIAAFTPPRRLEKDEVYSEDEILAAELNYFLVH